MLKLLETLLNVIYIVGYDDFFSSEAKTVISLTIRRMERIQRKSKRTIV